MAEEGDGDQQENQKAGYSYPLVSYSELNEELVNEISELCVTACEKYPEDNASAAKMLKTQMDQKVGAGWQVIVGPGFGFEVTYDVKSILLLYVGGNLGVLVWKCC